ncbi:hypothetical protein D9757_014646 [Collybiopsis confluens]|uniref:Uncharacterized protein n=1 Tax=Collybiopsis confluens TaxID=2823264 RepID=A0A8H5FNI4_9AGAR|nr:hypothetical protein D9757_014646 [Collybiopsis confluens]
MGAKGPQFFPDAHGFEIKGPTVFNSYLTPPSPQSTSQLTAISSSSLNTTHHYAECSKAKRFIESEVYASLLFLRGKGYPMWRPRSRNSRLPDIHKREGIQIGDLGFINDSGGFEYLFNICHSADHELNAGRVPQEFKPLLDIDLDDVADDAEEYEPGSHVASNPHRIHKSKIESERTQLQNVPNEVGAGFSFSSSTNKGAVLILPEGGKRVDHRQHSKFYNYAAEFARSWYQHINGPLARGIQNGSLYLVTGYDKARAWGVACFDDDSEDASANISMDFVPKPSTPGKAPKYWFPRCRGASTSSDSDDVFENQSGAVFLRGFKIAIRDLWLFPQAPEVTYISTLNADSLLPRHPSRTYLGPGSLISWKWPFLSSSAAHDHGPQEQEAIITSIPSRHQAYHPSDVINRWKLRNNDVDVVITHDNEWAPLILPDDEEMPEDEELITRMINFHLDQILLPHELNDMALASEEITSPSKLVIPEGPSTDFETAPMNEHQPEGSPPDLSRSLHYDLSTPRIEYRKIAKQPRSLFTHSISWPISPRQQLEAFSWPISPYQAIMRQEEEAYFDRADDGFSKSGKSILRYDTQVDTNKNKNHDRNKRRRRSSGPIRETAYPMSKYDIGHTDTEYYTTPRRTSAQDLKVRNWPLKRSPVFTDKVLNRTPTWNQRMGDNPGRRGDHDRCPQDMSTARTPASIGSYADAEVLNRTIWPQMTSFQEDGNGINDLSQDILPNPPASVGSDTEVPKWTQTWRSQHSQGSDNGIRTWLGQGQEQRNRLTANTYHIPTLAQLEDLTSESATELVTDDLQLRRITFENYLIPRNNEMHIHVHRRGIELGEITLKQKEDIRYGDVLESLYNLVSKQQWTRRHLSEEEFDGICRLTGHIREHTVVDPNQPLAIKWLLEGLNYVGGKVWILDLEDCVSPSPSPSV